MGRLKMRDIVLKYNGIFCSSNLAQIIAKTSASLQLSVSDMLTLVKFPTFTVADLRYLCCGGLIGHKLVTHCAERPRPSKL